MNKKNAMVCSFVGLNISSTFAVSELALSRVGKPQRAAAGKVALSLFAVVAKAA
ncbi:MAG: hypothetical protein GY822_31425 [Deltaproteobacteria bacterium]|nr:hypothetical protein [Deltaproteobacteria bacterium]